MDWLELSGLRLGRLNGCRRYMASPIAVNLDRVGRGRMRRDRTLSDHRGIGSSTVKLVGDIVRRGRGVLGNILGTRCTRTIDSSNLTRRSTAPKLFINCCSLTFNFFVFFFTGSLLSLFLLGRFFVVGATFPGRLSSGICWLNCAPVWICPDLFARPIGMLSITLSAISGCG
jgi:hypothetical protein